MHKDERLGAGVLICIALAVLSLIALFIFLGFQNHLPANNEKLFFNLFLLVVAISLLIHFFSRPVKDKATSEQDALCARQVAIEQDVARAIEIQK